MAQPGTASYTLDNTWEKGRRRLTLLEEICDPETTTRLRELGVGPGWRCLEVGAGAGSIARWLCEQVGPSGAVTAVDLETALMRDRPRPNLQIVQADLTKEALPGEGYDLVHARGLLSHLPNREALLRAMVERLRPGGVLLLEDGDFYPVATAESVAYAQTWATAVRAALTVGGDWYWARHLPARLAAAGAVEVAATTTVRHSHGGTPVAEFLALSLEQLTPLLEAAGLDPAVLAAANAAIDDPNTWLPSFAMVAASGRRPS